MSNIDKQARKESIINRLVSSFEPGSITDKQVDVLSDTVDLINDIFSDACSAEKRIADQNGIIGSARKFISEYAERGDIGAAEFVSILDRCAASSPKGE